jgi:hypothetical protein
MTLLEACKLSCKKAHTQLDAAKTCEHKARSEHLHTNPNMPAPHLTGTPRWQP